MTHFRKLNPHNPNQRGAIFVEFAFVFFIFISMIGGIIFFGLYFWRYEVLSESVAQTLRSVSVNPRIMNAGFLSSVDPEDENTNCSDYVEIINRVKCYVNTTYHLASSDKYNNEIYANPGDITFCADPDNGQCRLRARIHWSMPCFGFCSILPSMKDITVQLDSGIEDPCFLDDPGGCKNISLCS